MALQGEMRKLQAAGSNPEPPDKKSARTELEENNQRRPALRKGPFTTSTLNSTDLTMDAEDIGARNSGNNGNNGGAAGLVTPSPAQVSMEGIELMMKRLLGESEIRQQTFVRESFGQVLESHVEPLRVEIQNERKERESQIQT